MKAYLVALNQHIDSSDRTLEEIAEHLNFSESSLAKRLDGTVVFTVDEFYALCTFIKVPAGKIIDGAEPSEAVAVTEDSGLENEGNVGKTTNEHGSQGIVEEKELGDFGNVFGSAFRK